MMEPSKSEANMGGGSAAPVANVMIDQEAQVVVSEQGLPPPGGPYMPMEGQWKDHLFNCFANMSPSCITACFLPCCSLAVLAKRIGYGNFNFVFWFLMVLFCIGLFGVVIFYQLAVFVMTFQMLLILRAKLKLPALCGEKPDGCLAIMGDCLSAFFCTPCTIAQMMRHTFDYKERCDKCTLNEMDITPMV